MTSKQGRLYKIYCQVVKSQWNFLEHLEIYVKSINIQV